MKMKKLVAAALALSFMAGVAGCSKVKSVTEEDVTGACEDMDFDEIDDDITESFNEDMLDDGFYFVMDRDYIEDKVAEVGPYLRISGADFGVDFDSIDGAVMFGRWEGFDDVEGMEDPEDLEDVEFQVIAGVQITLDEYDQDVLYDIADGLDDMLRKINVHIDDLSSSEYKVNKDSLFLKIHVDAVDLINSFMESDFYDALLDSAPDDDEAQEFMDALQSLTGGASLAVYVADGNILIVAGASLNCESSYLSDFCDSVGVDDPSSLPNSEVVVEGIIETLDDYTSLFSSYIDRSREAAADYEYYGF